MDVVRIIEAEKNVSIEINGNIYHADKRWDGERYSPPTALDWRGIKDCNLLKFVHDTYIKNQDTI